MKKIILGLFTLMSISAFGLNLNIGVNANTGSAYTLDGISLKEGTKFDDPVYGVQLELTQGFIIGDLGVGMSYEPGYKVGAAEFNQMPVYVIGKVYLFPLVVKPYFAVKVGQTMYSGDYDLDNGFFYSASIGLTLIDMLQAEASYSVRQYDFTGNTVDSAFAITSLSLSYNLF